MWAKGACFIHHPFQKLSLLIGFYLCDEATLYFDIDCLSTQEYETFMEDCDQKKTAAMQNQSKSEPLAQTGQQ